MYFCKKNFKKTMNTSRNVYLKKKSQQRIILNYSYEYLQTCIIESYLFLLVLFHKQSYRRASQTTFKTPIRNVRFTTPHLAVLSIVYRPSRHIKHFTITSNMSHDFTTSFLLVFYCWKFWSNH